MDRRIVRSDALLLVTAAIWGFAFAAQRAGMEHVGPFLYTGVRFILGAVVLIPLWLAQERAARRRSGRDRAAGAEGSELPASRRPLRLAVGCAATGVLLFLGVTFQQVGLQYTSAGKAGFITGLYVILVPILGTLWKRRTNWGTWAGAVAAVAGLYLLSVRGGFRVSRGDLLVMVCAFFWALHVHVIAWLSPLISAVKLAVIQYFLCAMMSLPLAFALEPVTLAALRSAAVPILYGGICSVGIAYTLQVVAQRDAEPAHAAIILSLEGVFAVLGGFLVLGEVLELRSLLGAALMLAGMVLSQLTLKRGVREATAPERRPV